MAFKPTGYNRGRPRKGEIRPDLSNTQANISRNKWIESNYELYLESIKNAKIKFTKLNPEKNAFYCKMYRLRKKGWLEHNQDFHIYY